MIISDGAVGMGCPAGHVAAAAPSFNFQSDLLAATAATATEYKGGDCSCTSGRVFARWPD